jgi:hypothetical protein
MVLALLISRALNRTTITSTLIVTRSSARVKAWFERLKC